MRTKTKMKVLVAATLLALAPFAHGDDAATASGGVDAQVNSLDNTGASRGQAQVAERIAAQFRGVAGSDANAIALVNGLRNGTAVTLTSTSTATVNGKPTTTTTTTAVSVPTKPMGWGNVRIALALAQAQLQQAGITKPTAAQLQIALDGGTLKSPNGTTTQTQGVLTLRASGMGWGQIAQAQGTKPGPVLASLRHTEHEVSKLPVHGDGHDGKGETDKHAATSSKTPAATTTHASGMSPGGPSSKTTLTTAAGTMTSSSHASKGLTTAAGSPSSPHSSKGLTTASGAPPTAGTKGILTATGAPASASAHVTTAQGNSGGDSHGNGKGKGG